MERKICEECNGKIILKDIVVNIYGVSLGKFPAEVCQNCKEEIFSEETSKKIEELSKEKGLWGLDRKVKIIKMGNSLGVRIPKIIADFTGLKEGKEAIMKPEKNKLIIES